MMKKEQITKETTVEQTMSLDEVIDQVEQEKKQLKNNGVVFRGVEILERMFERNKVKELDYVIISDFQSVLSKVEKKKIEYSVVLYIIERSKVRDNYMKVKLSNGLNVVKKK